MSLLLAVANTVVATPLPSPQVVKEVTQLQPIVKEVATTPQPVLELFQLLAVSGAAIVTSLVHQIIERGRWNSNVNRLVLTTYSTGAALLTAFLTGHLGVSANDLTVEATAFMTALGSASGRYELWKFVSGLMQKPEPVSVTSTDSAPLPVDGVVKADF